MRTDRGSEPGGRRKRDPSFACACLVWLLAVGGGKYHFSPGRRPPDDSSFWIFLLSAGVGVLAFLPMSSRRRGSTAEDVGFTGRAGLLVGLGAVLGGLGCRYGYDFPPFLGVTWDRWTIYAGMVLSFLPLVLAAVRQDRAARGDTKGGDRPGEGG